MTDKTAVIEVRNLSKAFNGIDVLNEVDFTLSKGENVAILGRSGSGKSVFIKLIVGLLAPDNGKITVLGKQIDQLTEGELNGLRLHVGFAFQSSALYDSMSIYENLAFPVRMNFPQMVSTEVHNAVTEVLDAVGLGDKASSLPSELSGGQRKRIGIARTLVLKPAIMLYDEPTSGLDPITSAEINNLINNLQKRYNTSSIIITHDLTCARNTSDRVALLVDGKFARQGSFDEVFTSEDPQVKGFYDYNFIR